MYSWVLVGSRYLIATAMAEYMPETWTVMARAAPSVPELQVGIKGPAPVIEQFKALCAAERRTYSEMLEQLLARYLSE